MTYYTNVFGWVLFLLFLMVGCVPQQPEQRLGFESDPDNVHPIYAPENPIPFVDGQFVEYVKVSDFRTWMAQNKEKVCIDCITSSAVNSSGPTKAFIIVYTKHEEDDNVPSITN